ncbi:MAG: putative ATP-dependent transporter SufC [Alphaproteobacteria bacterium MarineAlpha6_Bin4]|nr:MAG: putative ATP-dependent transporter SufC [Alphaproteobacteria bacterium MarineAlpha6_Bin3]PPR37516.1 MAG: putative ATP-dependent transporter SufC [Alphaproteobacteria bacterium MarineAlpha6_Bin4]|tara:strand:+ start:1468 stop:2205 length:738 start_codon:yes stop_codon:yes gene_type:complete
MLKIENLHVNVEDKKILQGLNLKISPGETHAIMGPNGSGKSTLANVLSGKEGYDVKKGKITFLNNNLLNLEPEERAGEGLFLAFQYPVEIPGVSGMNFLRTTINSVRKYKKQKELDGVNFLKILRKKAEFIKMDENLIKRSVNTGFSGGEKKRSEILQMSLLEPKLAILDETDSGLDIDALKTVANGVNNLKNKERSFLIITHYQRLLNYIVPDKVHILSNGKIVKSGDKNLAIELEKKGYEGIK